MLSRLVLLFVAMMLLAGVWRQFVLQGPRGALFDSLALLPQWKFFGQSNIDKRDETFDDLHLLIRTGKAGNGAELWREILWNDDRHWSEVIWNPHMRSKCTVLNGMDMLCLKRNGEEDVRILSSLAYLTVLRHCLDAHRLDPDLALQFVVVATRGRGQRPLAVRFLSAWHTN